jgi:hypothetical protein
LDRTTADDTSTMSLTLRQRRDSVRNDDFDSRTRILGIRAADITSVFRLL